MKYATERAGHTKWPFAHRTIDTHTLCWMHMVEHGMQPPIDKVHKRSALNLDAVLNYCGIRKNRTLTMHSPAPSATLKLFRDFFTAVNFFPNFLNMKSPGSDKDKKGNDTSWGEVADWYGEHLTGEDTYHAKVIAPNLLRIVGPEKGMRILDLACGEGYFARMFKTRGAAVIGTDIAASLIEKAKRQSPDIEYHVADATKGLPFAEAESFDAVVCVLLYRIWKSLNLF